ncbi:MAG: sigma-70 family RNA polymerase sigma factor [Micrococcales bacterium]|nr:sigma-70 family RNA polymerase sigma factor [Micrococcales bacterium]
MSEMVAAEEQANAPSAETRQVVARHQDMVYAIAVTHTRCVGDADDVFQEVFLTYHRKQPECRDEEHRKAWLINTTLNCAKRLAAESWRTRVIPLTDDNAQALPDTFTFATEQQDAIFRALVQLPLEYRTVLFLFYLQDQPIARIAQDLGLEAGAVKMRLSRGRRLMREQLGELFSE